MLDENGNPPLRPPARQAIGVRRTVTLGLAAVGAGGVLTLWGLPAFTAAASLIIAGSVVAASSVAMPVVQRLRDRRERRRRARKLLETARMVTSAADVRIRAVVRVRGTVHALHRGEGGGGSPRTVAIDQGLEHASGRFAVLGEHLVAVVDDDCLEVWRRRGDDLLARSGGVVADGMAIEIVGPAHAAPVPDAVLKDGVPGGRDGALALCFDGAPDEPVLLFVS